MNRNRTLQDQAVSIQSGIEQLTGTVTRTTEHSIWAELSDGRTYRFTESQDGQWRLYGSDPRSAAVLQFTDAPDIRTEGYVPVKDDAELDALLAPMGWDVPVAVTRIEFTEEQATVADRIQRINALVSSWDEHEADARLKLSMSMLDSFRIEALVTAAGRLEPLRNMRVFLGKMLDAAVIGENGRVLELKNPALAEELLGQLVEIAQDAYESWYRPNSTSNIDVEIKLAAHEAWQSVYRVATGKRFY